MSLLRRPAPARPRFRPLEVVEVAPVAEHAVSVGFAVPADDPASESFLTYRPGQYVTLRAEVDGEDVRQSYSLWTPPGRARREGLIRVAAAEVQGGRMSPWLARRVRVGDVVGVLPPLGEFVLDEVGAARVHAAVAGGSGITPVLSILDAALVQHPDSRATLVLANRTRASSVLREEVARLEARAGGRFVVRDVLSREPGPHFGRVDAALLAQMWPGVVAPNGSRVTAPVGGVDDWWLCGPEGLNALVEGWLAEHGVDPDHVHRERFTSTGPVDPVTPGRSLGSGQPVPAGSGEPRRS